MYYQEKKANYKKQKEAIYIAPKSIMFLGSIRPSARMR